MAHKGAYRSKTSDGGKRLLFIFYFWEENGQWSKTVPLFLEENSYGL